MGSLKIGLVRVLVAVCATISVFVAPPADGQYLVKSLPGHIPAALKGIPASGRLAANTNLSLAVGLPLRNEAALDQLLAQLYDPRSTNFHRFIAPAEFAARFGPGEGDYQALQGFFRSRGLMVEGTHPNRLILDIRGGVANIERAFNLTLRTYSPAGSAKIVFAPDSEPSVPAELAVSDVWGLTDFGRPRPMSHPMNSTAVRIGHFNGSGSGGTYQGSDFRHAYAPGSRLTGAGQIVAVAEFDGYYPADIAAYEAQSGYAAIPLENVIVDSVSGIPGYSGDSTAVAEVSLDIELAIAMAPGISKLMVYEGSSPYDLFNRIVTDNQAKQVIGRRAMTCSTES